MRQQGSLAQDSLAHGFEVVKRRFIAQVAQSLPHLREGQLRLVAQAEKSFSTAHLLSRSRHFQNLIRGHGVRPGFAWVAAEDAVAAIITAQVRQRDEAFARIGENAGLEALLELQGCGEKIWEFIVRATQELASSLA